MTVTAGTKPPHRLRQLETDVAATEHDEMLGDSFELESFDVRHRRCIAQPRYIRDGRACAHVEKHTVSDNRPCVSVAAVNGHRLRADEAGQSP